MGNITPKNNEYNLLSGFIEEALDLLGQECLIYLINDTIKETPSDSILYYDKPIKSNILFEDDLRDVKMKGKHWDKEVDMEFIAYIGLDDLSKIKKHCIVETTPSFFNAPSKFLITDIYGQVNSTYARVKLVPYRQSLRTELDVKKDTETKYTENGIVYRKSHLKR